MIYETGKSWKKNIIMIVHEQFGRLSYLTCVGEAIEQTMLFAIYDIYPCSWFLLSCFIVYLWHYTSYAMTWIIYHSGHVQQGTMMYAKRHYRFSGLQCANIDYSLYKLGHRFTRKELHNSVNGIIIIIDYWSTPGQ